MAAQPPSKDARSPERNAPYEQHPSQQYYGEGRRRALCISYADSKVLERRWRLSRWPAKWGRALSTHQVSHRDNRTFRLFQLRAWSKVSLLQGTLMSGTELILVTKVRLRQWVTGVKAGLNRLEVYA